jgi:hypothetical protein
MISSKHEHRGVRDKNAVERRKTAFAERRKTAALKEERKKTFLPLGFGFWVIPLII